MAIVIDGTAGITFPDASVQVMGAGYMNGSQIFTSTGSFTVPLGVTKVWVTGVGGGGSAGTNTSCVGGAGGNGAKAFRQPITVTPGSVHTVTVGVGGVASSFGSLFTIANGVNGTNATPSAAGTDSGSGTPQWVNGVSADSVDGVSILSAVAGSGLGRARGSGLVGWAGIMVIEW